MRAVIQRVTESKVVVGEEVCGAIGRGLLVLLGVAVGDTAEECDWLVGKIARLRIFADDRGLMNRSVVDIGGEALVVSQFTLLGSAERGNRPSFDAAARPDEAVPLYERFVASLAASLGRPVATGRFGADMRVSLVNDGPVTLWIDTRNRA
ncbi:MAG: D-tyrosyl-tRNA(Tyr) deacylase [Verrucomicrobiales bacterium]|nr:D-tyrosyl-tRNA(Tyr) deacylase [Verrucomicrobiales bacterium]